MTDEEFELLRDELIRDQDRWRDKHGIWLASYYGGLLTSLGIIAAVAQFVEPKSDALSIVPNLICCLSVGCAILVILRMKGVLDLYQAIGYDALPNHQNQIENYRSRTEKAKKDFQRRKPFHSACDWATFIIPIVVFVLFTITVSL